MGGIFGGGSSPKPPKPVVPEPEPPSIDTEAVEVASDAQRRRERKAAGRASTMLTGSGGVSGSGTSVGTKTLLGR